MNLKGIRKLNRIKFLSFFLVFFLLICAHSIFINASERETTLKEDLMILGIIKDGTGVYDTNVVNKQEMVTVLVRMLGKEKEALSKDSSFPFTDVAKWNEKYVSFVYNEGLLKGSSDTTFGGTEYFGINHAVTFMLRTLGFEDEKDFEWNKAYDYALKIGLLSEEDKLDKDTFTRADMFKLIEKTLKFNVKDTKDKSLIRKLVDEDAYKEEDCNETTRFSFLDKTNENIITKIIKKVSHRNSGGNTPSEEKVLTDITVEPIFDDCFYIGKKPQKEDLRVYAIYNDDYTKKEIIKDYTHNLDTIDENSFDIQTIEVSYTENGVTKTDSCDIVYDYLYFGYVDELDEPRPWIVLDVDETNNKMLITDLNAILYYTDLTPAGTGINYYAENVPVSYKDSSLRHYVNDIFYHTYFDYEEQLRILETTLEDGLTNYIFVLSKEEVERYFTDETSRVLYDFDDDPQEWWLRCPEETLTPYYVDSEGKIETDGVNKIKYTRLAMWVTCYPFKATDLRIYPYTNTYLVGDEFDPYEFFIEVEFENGDTAYIDPSDVVFDSSVDMSTPGTKTIKVTFTDYDGTELYASCNINVMEIGTIIEYGEYQKSSSSSTKEPMEWIVIEIADGEIYAISKDIIDQKKFDSNSIPDISGYPEIYDWMNSEFIKSFSLEERLKLIEIYLPMLQDFESLDNVNKAKPTDYALSKGVNVDASGYGAYWIIGDGVYNYIKPDGEIYSESELPPPNTEGIGFRPVICISSYDINISNAIVDEIVVSPNANIFKGEELTNDNFNVFVMFEEADPLQLFEFTSNVSEIDTSTAGEKTIEVSAVIDGVTYNASNTFTVYDIGDTFIYGSYFGYFDDDYMYDYEVDEVEWIVLDIDNVNKQALVISKELLDCLPYNEELEEVDYKDADISNSYNEFSGRNRPGVVFFDDTRKRYFAKRVYIPDIDIYARMFLLSENELNGYFADDTDKKCSPVDEIKDAYSSELTGGYGSWWLRTPTATGCKANIVLPDGTIGSADVNASNVFVRLSFWYDYDMNIINKPIEVH